MKLCYISITEESVTRPFLEILNKVSQKVLRPDTQMSIKSVDPGLTRATDGHPYFQFLNQGSIIEKAIEAERNGFDAVVVGCYDDPGVKEARATIDIPVIGIGEASMHYACLLGRRFAVVGLNEPNFIPLAEDAILSHGLQMRAISNPVRLIKTSNYDVFTKGMENPHIVAEDVMQRAEECVADGADTVIIGCNGLGPLCTLAGLVKIEESNVPILDCVSIGLKMAETVHEINKTLGIPYISRNRLNALPRDKDMKRIRGHFGLEKTA